MFQAHWRQSWRMVHVEQRFFEEHVKTDTIMHQCEPLQAGPGTYKAFHAFLLRLSNSCRFAFH